MALRPSKLILHSRNLSECSARVRVAAALKHIPLEIVEHKPGAGKTSLFKDEMYGKMNPNTTLPTLEAHYGNGEPLILKQSLSMLEFLEETYPEAMRLIPPVADMAARSQVRDLALFMACDFQPLQTARALQDLDFSQRSPDQRSTMESRLANRGIYTARLSGRSMRVYEKMVAQSAGSFSVGDNVSIADVCLVTRIQSLSRVRKPFKEVMGYPTVSRILKSCEGIDAFRLHGVPSRSEVPGPPRSPNPATTASRRDVKSRSTIESGNEVAG